MNIAKFAIVAAAGSLLTAAGCAKKCCEPMGYQDPFFPTQDKHVAQRVGRQQEASAARKDATLFAHHFFGGELNSLGERKLNLMMEDDDTSRPIIVYLATPPEDSLNFPRREAVTAYLQSQGVSADEIRLESGLNPGSGTPTAGLLQNMSKTDSVGDGGGNGTSASGAGGK